MIYKILPVILLCSLSVFALVFAADDSELIGIVNELQKQTEPENNQYQEEVNRVYETMKEAKPVEVSIPPYTVFKDDQADIMKMFNLPEAEDAHEGESCVDPEQLGDYRVFVFISESVPETTLKNYMRDAKKRTDILLVMRGVIGSADHLKPTLSFMTKLSCGKEYKDLKPDDSCAPSRVDINPLLFSLFGVKQVPAVVLSKLSYSELLIRENMGQPLKNDEYFIIRGDMGLDYAFEKFANVGADVDKYLKALQGNYGG